MFEWDDFVMKGAKGHIKNAHGDILKVDGRTAMWIGRLNPQTKTIVGAGGPPAYLNLALDWSAFSE